MRTPLELMKLFVSNRTPSFEYSPKELKCNCKDYTITNKQYQWLLSVVYHDIKKGNRIPRGWVSINGVTYTDNTMSYSIVSAHKKTCIRVSDWSNESVNAIITKYL